MNPKIRTTLSIIGILLALFLMWYFSTITGYIIGAVVLSMVVTPLMESLARKKIGKKGRTFPRWLASLTTLLVVLIILLGFLFLIVPLVAREARMVAQIDPEALSKYSNNVLYSIQMFLQEHGWLEQITHMEVELMDKLKGMLSVQNVGMAFSSVVSFISSFVVGIFSIFFLSFFFLKDREKFKTLFLSIFPRDKQYKVKNVLSKIRSLLSRYFIGLLIQLTVVILLEFIGLISLGIPNALLIAFIGGFMNIIPYIGPVIGGTIGVLLAIVSTLAGGVYVGLGWVIVKVVAVFVVANIIDNSVSQPLIFSKSVNAHPVEIFVVILAAGYVSGIGGMIVAIPVYTVIRIILKEYLSEFAFINNITKNI